MTVGRTLTGEQLLAIQQRWMAGETQKALCHEFGIGYARIHKIVNQPICETMPNCEEAKEATDVPGWPGYRVNKMGVVFSCRTPGKPYGHRWRRSKQWLNPTGYWEVSLHNNRKTRLFRVHSLVLMAFVGPCPEGMWGCHGDNNPQNNNLSNLRWDTPQGNIDDRERADHTAYGTRNGRAKLTLNQVMEVRQLRAAGLSYGKIAKRLGASKRQIMRIAKGESWGRCFDAPGTVRIIREALLDMDANLGDNSPPSSS